MEFIKNNIRWIMLGGNVATILGLFLPFVTVSATVFGTTMSESADFIDGDGVIVLFAVIVAAVLIFIKKDKVALAPLGLSLVITLYDALNAGNATKDVAYGSLYDVDMNIGFYVILIGLIVSIGSIIYENYIQKNETN